MSQAQLSPAIAKELLRCLSENESTSIVEFDYLVKHHYVPKKLQWRPTACLARGGRAILFHVLVMPQLPEYVKSAVRKLKAKYRKTDVVILATEITTEATEESESSPISAAQVAGRVAADCLKVGAGLIIQTENGLRSIFPSRYSLRRKCPSRMETGHVPGWLYRGIASHEQFSPYLARTIRRFAKRYAKKTARDSIANSTECELLETFARDFAHGDKRLLFPLGQLDVLREYESSGAKKNARDHFFHTFNNLFLGFYILGLLARDRRFLADVDRFISGASMRPGLKSWETLWFLTCLFHDRAYVSEDLWGAFRFVFGAEQDTSEQDPPVPAEQARKIQSMWDTVSGQARKDLRDLYDRTVRKWLPPSVRKKKNPDFFDASLRAVYFDGRNASHSIGSALKLINTCRGNRVPQHASFDKAIARASCVIAALSMLFHDQRTREKLCSYGIGPIAFERLPYAAALMFVDCLQDDRRDISCARFREHGVLKDVTVSSDGSFVNAVVCLREVPIAGWPKRIAEYESVMQWINAESDTKFNIDYRTLANL